MHICYIHGFLSGSAAVKSTILKNYIKESRPDLTFSAPDFPDTPKEAHDALIAYFEDLTKKYPKIGLVGSSMGGFFSTLLSGVFGFRTVLLNPCVHPQDYFQNLIGDHVNTVTGERFTLKPQMLDTLKALDASIAFNPCKIKVYLQDGDEVLDYKKSLSFYNKSEIVLMHGGCHAFTDFIDIVPEALAFLENKN